MTFKENKELSVILVSYNTEIVLKESLRRITNYTQNIPTEIIVVDNASSDNSVNMVRTGFPQVKLIECRKNKGFAAGNNIGIKIAVGNYVLLLNSDAFVSPDTVEKSIKTMRENPKTGILGIQQICPNGDPQVSARTIPNAWHKFLVISGLRAHYPKHYLFGCPDYGNKNLNKITTVDWISGAYFLIRKEVIDQIGLLDEKYFMYYEEVDYCMAAQKAGWTVKYDPTIKVIHLGGASTVGTGKSVSQKSRQVLEYRFESEIYFYLKNFSRLSAYLNTLVEIFWNKLIIMKNKIRQDKDSALKIAEASNKNEIAMNWLLNLKKISH